ncbi:Gfo/Idh/MocA family oxidoreductase [Microbacterium sp. KSW-18]|uniref:Gfo/Idh/MocA family oxidoreductase n=1 Tax=Microbacterium aquilitoris TaxID=3067307 RepID=A0ABU3GFY0_9MICO|nr:Gfo/Idh/MocA family oxidoreductase [Microbacterium sp. KSW-18]MDT3329603.1 Gfo/Idh/MocA family oxidoreductase [Microbacterium sp. KSW-18]
MAESARFAIIGTGWRSEFFLRIAAAAPERLQAVGVLARSDASAARVAGWNVPIHRSLDDLLAARPDFVIASVSWPAMPAVITELVERGVRVLAETPPAPDADGLRKLWHDVGASRLVQVAEQYMLMPGHAARLEVVRSGAIGSVGGVQVSSTHLYHATSMIRTFLDAGMAEATVSARTFTATLVDPLTPAGWSDDVSPQDRTTTIATLDFGDGRMGLYDFVDNQWWNPILSRRIVLRGSHGELTDDTVRRFEGTEVITSPITYRRTGVDLNLEGNDVVSAAFEGRIVYRNPWVGTRLSEDDIAVASLLELTGRWALGDGAEPYPLADACQDHLLGLAIGESARTGADVRVAPDVWS